MGRRFDPDRAHFELSTKRVIKLIEDFGKGLRRRCHRYLSFVGQTPKKIRAARFSSAQKLVKNTRFYGAKLVHENIHKVFEILFSK